MNNKKKKSILICCMGNICRSPTGEAVLKAKAAEMGIDVVVDSAGTIAYHQGNPPDNRARAAGEKRGYSFHGMQARQVTADDFEHFDLILAADKANLADLKAQCPTAFQYKLSLFLSHGGSSYAEIPDPYYGGEDGFELVLDLLEESAEAVLREISQNESAD
ncbi:Low molecular weight protein-tyrosine-phosphatase YfkJ [Vibrio aerogenes CECT 7868]|uniref:protein-tyrosine-phosphatase n=1 Tax=Vibrio aerogenes CECT 7868 TaxID=1216006 RepID=A0A1M5Z929_9VIBR|nr:low molecular weight protein-tyrosine-phosphatase [Vibrio aerogenes]SHI20730.1 Low molecular weight protein-tyrosine-phosphatase YfkJ [Vibrio aerogenes CECT 7868]